MFRLYLYDGSRAPMKLAPDMAAAVDVVFAAFDGRNPAADVVTVVYNDRKVGQLRRWNDGAVVLWSKDGIERTLSALIQLWGQAPASKPHGARTCSRKARMIAVIDRYNIFANSPSAREEFIETVWEAVK